jgi:hypothetical protein
MTSIVFKNNIGKILFYANTLCNGVTDIIKHSNLTAELSSNNLNEFTTCGDYKIGDILFVYYHEKNFEVIGFSEDEYPQPILQELSPINPKFPIKIFTIHCNFPKVVL